MLQSDGEIDCKDNDLMGSDLRAQKLANLLCGLKPSEDPESLVIGLTGPWGSGKSSCARLLRKEIEAEARGPDRPRVMEFNAWLFASRAYLPTDFLRELEACLGGYEENLRHEIHKMVAVITAFTTKSPSLRGRPGETASEFLEVKRRLERRMRDKKQRIVAIVDDIDRLTTDEIRKLFWLVKLIANLPFVYYVLLYDHAVVVKALDGIFPGRGHSYLARIVQITVNLPLPSQKVLTDVLERCIADTFGAKDSDTALGAWGKAWKGGLGGLVSTLRDAKLLANAVQVSHALGHDASHARFFAAEGLRVLAPGVFQHIRDNFRTYLTAPPFRIPYRRRGLGVRPEDQTAVERVVSFILQGIAGCDPPPTEEAARRLFWLDGGGEAP